MPVARIKYRIDHKNKKLISEFHGDVVFNGSTKMGETAVSYKKNMGGIHFSKKIKVGH